jgi:hypothetical protein
MGWNREYDEKARVDGYEGVKTTGVRLLERAYRVSSYSTGQRPLSDSA